MLFKGGTTKNCCGFYRVAASKVRSYNWVVLLVGVQGIKGSGLNIELKFENFQVKFLLPKFENLIVACQNEKDAVDDMIFIGAIYLF